MTRGGPVAGLGGAAKWKGGLLQHAADVFSRRGADLQALIYGQRAVTERLDAAQQPARSAHRDASSDDDELFASRRPSDGQAAAKHSGGIRCLLMTRALVHQRCEMCSSHACRWFPPPYGPR